MSLLQRTVRVWSNVSRTSSLTNKLQGSLGHGSGRISTSFVRYFAQSSEQTVKDGWGDAVATDKERAQLSAFAARTGFRFSDKTLLIQALTHISYKHTAVTSSERLQFLGDKVLQFYVAEYLFAKYPKAPADTIDSLLDAYCGRKALASLGQQFGIGNVIRWKLESAEAVKVLPLVSANVMKALIGALYQEKGPQETRAFVHANILTRSVDAAKHLHVQIEKPRAMLLRITEQLGKPRPVARILKETGRWSPNPVFVVGIFIGPEKISEGYGSSLSMAEIRATRQALEDHYLAEASELKLPSDALDTSFLEQHAKLQ